MDVIETERKIELLDLLEKQIEHTCPFLSQVFFPALNPPFNYKNTLLNCFQNNPRGKELFEKSFGKIDYLRNECNSECENRSDFLSECPICLNFFASNKIEAHASSCQVSPSPILDQQDIQTTDAFSVLMKRKSAQNKQSLTPPFSEVPNSVSLGMKRIKIDLDHQVLSVDCEHMKQDIDNKRSLFDVLMSKPDKTTEDFGNEEEINSEEKGGVNDCLF